MSTRILSNRELVSGELTYLDVSKFLTQTLRWFSEGAEGVVDWVSLDFSIERESVESLTFMRGCEIEHVGFELYASVYDVIDEEEALE